MNGWGGGRGAGGGGAVVGATRVFGGQGANGRDQSQSGLSQGFGASRLETLSLNHMRAKQNRGQL